jgi:hypothetical protein
MTEQITAPFTPNQVVALNAWQSAGYVHPFTCGNRTDGAHLLDGVLIATVRGWICLFCDYEQDWAHQVMTHELPVNTIFEDMLRQLKQKG